MANPERGEIGAEIDGEYRVLCLTLAGLAELEAAFGVSSIGALLAQLQTGALSARQVAAVLGAGLRGGGTPVADEEIMGLRWKGGPAAMTALAARLLRTAFSCPQEEAPNPPAPQAV